MNGALLALRKHAELSPLDLHFAEAITRMAGDSRPEVLAAAALVSKHTAAGHVCVSLQELPPLPGLALPPLEDWVSVLRSSPLVGEDARPLVLDERGRLYLARYWRYERDLAEALNRRAAARRATPLAPELLDVLDRLFPQEVGAVDPGREAAESSLVGLLTVLSGGPGTGKTSLVVKLLALFAEERRLAGGPPMRASLLAPTGKAAARLAESIRAKKVDLPIDEGAKAAIAETTATIHRALGWQRADPTRFAHDRENPLETDVVVVDEASMVDLALLAKLVDALPPNARLILLGDEDQLSSVEVGAILGDITNRVGLAHAPSPPIANCIFRLQRSHRFGEGSDIGTLARAIRKGEVDETLDILRDPRRSGVQLVDGGPAKGLPRGLVEDAVSRYRPYFSADTPEGRAAAFGEFRVLAAHVEGTRGVVTANREIERALARADLIRAEGVWYAGQPVMVHQNDYQLELYNGDIGFLMSSGAAELKACFVGESGQVRRLSPARLPAHDTVYAMTIHKSQGSEMDAIGVLFPEHDSRLCSRELLYTAVTRARNEVKIYASPEALKSTIERRVTRASGLTERLWGGAPSAP